MNRVCRAAATAAFLMAAPAPGQPPNPEPSNLRGDSAQTRKRLTEAEQKLTAGQAADAADALQRVLDDASDDLVSIDGKHFRSARWVAHRILTRLPAETLKGYRDRVEDPARNLLDAGKKARDPAPLWTLIDRYFVSRPADEGSLLLGDLLFERGEFRTADRVWRRLLPDAGADVVYPGSNADAAAVRARLILAAVFLGETERAKTELAAFRQKHPDAKGVFAGKDGPYADALQAYLDAPPKNPPAANGGRDWPTFGGAPDRVGRSGVRLPTYWPAGRPTWPKELDNPQLLTGHRHGEAATLPPERPPFGHPVIANGRVFVTDGSGLYGFDLRAGAPLTMPNRIAPWVPPPHDQKKDKTPPDPSPSLTAVGDRVYVRAGPPFLRPPEAGKGDRADETAIVCLGPGEVKDLNELWRLRPPGDGKIPTAWEGAPLVAGRRMWAAFARFEGGRVVHGLACYDPADAGPAPPVAWTTEVCDSPLTTGGDPRVRQELLTLAGRNVVLCSNAGTVAAVDAVTGRRAWGFRYPRGRRADAHRSPDSSPAVYCDGRVYVAPIDADHVYALDAETGHIVWESGQTDGAQILGVAAGKLIVSVVGPVGGLRGLGLANGSHREPYGWVIHNAGGPLSYGRGFVTDELVVWPTRAGLFFVRPEDGRNAGRGALLNPLGGSHAQFFGHLAFADGVLVVVTPTQVWGYVTDAKRFGVPDGFSVRDPVQAKFEELTDRAERSLADGDAAAARALLLAALGGEFPPPLRAWAAARLLMLVPRIDGEEKLPNDLLAALTPELRTEWVVAPDGIPATLDTLVRHHSGREPMAREPLPISPPVDERKPIPPNLAADAEISRTMRLPLGTAPLRWMQGMEKPPTRVFLTKADELVALPLAGGAESRFAAIDGFTHAAEVRDGFIATGRFAVALYAAGRTPVWVFRVPLTDPLPIRAGEARVRTGESHSPPQLSAFRLTGSWLVACLGKHHLIAFDLRGRRVAWVLGSNGRQGFSPFGFPGAVRFGAEFLASGRLIVAQLSDGRRWFIRVETGKVLDSPVFDQPTSPVWWNLPPAEVEPNRLVVADGPGIVRLLDLPSGRVKWTHEATGEASLAGDPPQVKAWGGKLVLAVRRNHGVELDRLDPSDGKSVWPDGPAFLDADRVNFRHADSDADRVYAPAGRTLVAVSLADGKPAWEAELPDTFGAGGWVVRAGKNCVIAYPEVALPREPVGDVFARVARSFARNPRAARLPGLGFGAYDAWVKRSVPVLLFDPETGKRLARHDIPATGPAVTAWFERDVAMVATGDRVVWLR